MARLTPWFPGNVKPARKGVYERPPSWEIDRYSYWDGKTWRVSAQTIADAFRYRTWPDESADQSAKWRGLAKEPK